jgi:hypothetical protein
MVVVDIINRNTARKLAFIEASVCVLVIKKKSRPAKTGLLSYTPMKPELPVVVLKQQPRDFLLSYSLAGAAGAAGAP